VWPGSGSNGRENEVLELRGIIRSVSFPHLETLALEMAAHDNSVSKLLWSQ
jgi:hypothetical protein